MSVIQGIILGLVQGVAEFLPISSSGHLVLIQHLFGLTEVPLLFDVCLHLGTLVAVFVFFRKKIWELLCAFGRLIARKPYKAEGLSVEQCAVVEKNNRQYILSVIIATAVTGILGVVNKKTGIADSMLTVSIGFIFTAILLVASALVEKFGKKKTEAVENNLIPAERKSPSWWQALIIGFAQGIGTLPGVSRSGSTIAGSLFCGVNRQQAGEFSFIASIPAILGAFILDVKDLGSVTSSVGILPLIIGTVVAGISGYAALAWLMKLIKKGRLEWFAAYLIPLGIAGLVFLC